MTLYCVTPRDPLVVRDGRPNDARSESRTLPFPLPSVVAGVVRTGLGRRDGAFDTRLVPALLRDVAIRGPLLAGAEGLLVPAPGDALVMRREDGGLQMRALRPLRRPEGTQTSQAGMLVGLRAEEVDKGKPARDVPRFWRWAAFEEWLRHPASYDDAATRALLTGGVTGLSREERVHVAISESLTAEEGKLFSAEGLRGRGALWDGRALALGERARETDLSFEIDVQIGDSALEQGLDGLRPMGGERRLMHWSTSASASWPAAPGWLTEHVEASEQPVVRVVLLTPAFVTASLRPTCFERPGVEILAAKVDRPETMSGWDMTKGKWGRGAPKKTRRLAAAGAAFWLRLSGSADERRQWLEETWMRNVGDDEQLCRDGFGLAVVGIGRMA